MQLSVSPGGLPKRAVAEARVTRLGLTGDAHRDLEHHGGPDRAVCLFPIEAIEGLLEVTKYTSPCFNIAPLFQQRDVSRVSQKRHPGWSRVYARVLAEGSIHPGDAVRLVPIQGEPSQGSPSPSH